MVQTCSIRLVHTEGLTSRPYVRTQTDCCLPAGDDPDDKNDDDGLPEGPATPQWQHDGEEPLYGNHGQGQYARCYHRH